MNIVIHIRSSDNDLSSANNLHEQCFPIMAAKHPGHQFIFISDRPLPPGKFQGNNIKTVVMPPQIRNRLLQHYWYNYKIPNFLEKYHADLFICNAVACSLRTGVKQCLILDDLSFMEKKNGYAPGDNRYIKKHFSKFIKKVSCIAVTHPQAVSTLGSKYPDAGGKTHCIGFGRYKSTLEKDAANIQSTKDHFAEGREYFLAFINDASQENTLTLLKAFSLFKKRQLSNMQLVLLVTGTHKTVPVSNLENYKYRNEVRIIFPEKEEEVVRLTVAAYASVYLPATDTRDNQCMLSLFNEVPVIATDSEFNRALYADAVLYSPADEKKLAEAMMLIYKDENIRNELQLKGKAVAADYTWEQTAAKLWGFLQESAVQTA